MTSAVECGTFVPRVPSPITAVRYDGSPQAADAVVALFVDSGVTARESAGGLALAFPDGRVVVPIGSWVWYEDHGYDRAPASVLSDEAFRAAYTAAPPAGTPVTH